MNPAFFLLWFVFVSPDGSADYQRKLEPSMVACHADGDKVAQEAMDAVMAKELTTYYGGCESVAQDEVDAVSKDARGSI